MTDTAEVIDFDAFRRQREEARTVECAPIAPMMVWVPVWVMMAQPMIPAFR